MNKLEQIIHRMVGDYPFLRIPLVVLYQRACTIIPSRDFERVRLESCSPGFFFGSHDKTPWSHDDSKLLAHRFDVKKNISQLEDGTIDVGYFENDEYQVIGTTKAWNWQQGSSLMWIGKMNKVVYNDIEQGESIAKLIDLETGDKQTIHCHIMAVSNNGRYALSCSFVRLGRGMPGYGYDQLSDGIENVLLPDNEGLSIIDLENNTIKQIITLKEIAKIASNNLMDGAYHFFTHCLFSPGDNRFVFFHRYLRQNGSLETRMFSSELDGKNIWQFVGEKFSHIAWYNDTTVLAYCKPPNKRIGFYFIEEFSGKITGMVNEYLTSDGHPQVSSNGKYVIIDTYPDRCRNQRLMLYNVKNNHCELLVKYKIPFKYRLEMRCDFHPRWSRDNTKICFDSAHKNVRALCVMCKPMSPS